MPTVVVTTTAFEPLTVEVARTLGFDSPRIAVVAHPLGGVDEAGVIARADGVLERLVSLFTG